MELLSQVVGFEKAGFYLSSCAPASRKGSSTRPAIGRRSHSADGVESRQKWPQLRLDAPQRITVGSVLRQALGLAQVALRRLFLAAFTLQLKKPFRVRELSAPVGELELLRQVRALFETEKRFLVILLRQKEQPVLVVQPKEITLAVLLLEEVLRSGAM